MKINKTYQNYFIKNLKIMKGVIKNNKVLFKNKLKKMTC